MMTRASFPAALVACLLLILAPSADAQDALQLRYDSADVAWQEGRYLRALERMDAVIAAPGGERFLDEIALLTGELYHTVELAPDGGDLRWSDDSRYAAYTVEDEDRETTYVVRVDDDGPTPLASITGSDLVFHPGAATVAYLALDASPAYEAARAEAMAAVEVVDRASMQRRNRLVAGVEAAFTRVMVRDLSTGRERALDLPGIAPHGLGYAPDGGTLFVVGARDGDEEPVRVFALRPDAAEPVEVMRVDEEIEAVEPLADGRHLLVRLDDGVAIHDLVSGGTTALPDAQSAAAAADGSAIVYLTDEPGADGTAVVVRSMDTGRTVVVARSDEPVANPALSPDGRLVVYQRMPREDWELYVVRSDGQGEERLTREIQHDLYPRFVDDRRVLAVIGEGRHRRSQLYDLDALASRQQVAWLRSDGDAANGSAEGLRFAAEPMPADATAGPAGPRSMAALPRVRSRLFHNNTIRTIAPEYEWAVSPDGRRVLIVAERDGDTISPERGVYLVDLTREVTVPEVRRRIAAQAAAERDLRERGRRMFAPIAERVRAAVSDVSVARIYEYEKDLFEFDSKYITEPGNRKALEYLANRLEGFGYEVELQWFDGRGARSANVIARLPGTVNPELVYVISSHFDSTSRGPGADDNTSGTAALLEAARVLVDRPQPATIEFAFFTGEEAGLLGSREYVRRAVESGKNIVGALNNDMIGYANDARLDNTIRYSNAGIRDLQHAAAFLFTDLILYDAHYYKSTDAAAYYEAYGDIVGGIGSYPVLGNPHYHQPHDVLETINHQLVAEVSKTTVASIMRLASSPARLAGLELNPGGGAVEVSWDAAPERGVEGYVVAYGPESDPLRARIEVDGTTARLEGVEPGTVVSVKAVDASGLDGWDWARAVVGQAGG